MNLNPIGSNQTEIETIKYRILFSYKTPVALFDKVQRAYYKTDTFYSVTTSKHINRWLAGADVRELEQGLLNVAVGRE